jgi:hypothetical protein
MQTELNQFFRLGSPRTGSDKQMIQLDPHTSKSTSIRIAFIEPGCMRRSGRMVGLTPTLPPYGRIAREPPRTTNHIDDGLDK